MRGDAHDAAPGVAGAQRRAADRAAARPGHVRRPAAPGVPARLAPQPGRRPAQAGPRRAYRGGRAGGAPGPAQVAAELRLRPGDSALRLERVREFDGRPAVHQVSWVRRPVADRIRDRDFTGVSLYTALADAGVTVARASEVVRPGLLDAAAARHLGEPQGSPVLISTRITYTLDATPVVSDHATILGSMMEIRTERAATGLSLTWGATS
ncbi:GntR family transcriptional regulator [Nonomuraea rubra]|uniref:GntR family transcriptional regulator n=1 Tax=Nonomuraea rubra TaxID=46180 RepID=UPI00360A0808